MQKMYKILAILMITILIIMCTQIISNAKNAVVTAEGLNLRKEPNADSTILDQISENEKVEILESGVGSKGDWYKVKYKGITGYVKGEFIKIDGSSNAKPNNTANQNTNSTTNKTTNTTNTTTNNVTTNVTNTLVNENIANNVNNEITNNVVENNIVSNNTIEEKTVETNQPAEITEPVNIQPIEINTYKTAKEGTTVYIVPLINASKIYTTKLNENLYVMQVLNGWAYVNGENTSGWIRCANLM